MAAGAGSTMGRGDAVARLTVRLAFLGAAGFLILGLALTAAAACQLVWPGELGTNEMLSYGRAFPAGAAALLFGWVTLAFFGFAFDAVPRHVRAPLAMPLAALGAVGLAAAGAAGGVAMLLLGENEGGRWLEFPLPVDGALLLAAATAAGVLVLTCRRAPDRSVPLPVWFLTAATVWLTLGIAAGAIPGLVGLQAEVQSAFTGAALFGGWAATAGVGVAYSVVARTVGAEAFNERLGRVGFWSLGLAWLFSAARVLQHAPTNDWIETIPVVFGAGLVVSVIAIVTDFAGAVRGRWSELAASAAAKFAIAGLGFLLFTVAMAFVASLRSVAAVLGLTFWESGVETAALLGGFTLFAIAACVGASEVLRGRTWGRRWARATLLPVVGGAGIAAGAQLTAGVQQGVRWLSGVQTGEYANSGPGFGAGLDALRGPSLVHAVGLALVAVGALFFALRLLTMSFGRGSDDSVTAAGFATQPIDALLRRAVAVFALAGVGAFALPAIDSAPEASVLAESSRDLSGPAALGREIYIAEGCWYCHTQQVRQVLTDVGLGPVSVPGDYVYDPAGLAGVRRIGPDLTHVASRPEGSDAAVVRAHLLAPGGDSTMPSYAHLTDAELEALAAYVTALE